MGRPHFQVFPSRPAATTRSRWCSFASDFATERRLPEPIAHANAVVVGGLLGLATWIGELPKSLIKRQIGIPPGQQLQSPVGLLFAIVDQPTGSPSLRFWIRPIWKISPRETTSVFALAVAVRVAINLIGYAIGARERPI